MNYFKGNQHVGSFKIRATRWLGRTTKKTIVYAGVLSALGWYGYGAMVYGGVKSPLVVHAEKIVEVEIEAPVMARIAKCESSGMHKRNGQVVFNANTNGSVDIGYYQINSIWSKKATELGYDLTNEADNKAFAMWLYKNFGTEPWYSTEKCWNR